MDKVKAKTAVWDARFYKGFEMVCFSKISLNSQGQSLRQFCDANGIDVDTHYEDDLSSCNSQCGIVRKLEKYVVMKHELVNIDGLKFCESI